MSGIISQNAANSTGLIKAAAAGGAWTKIKTLTASSSADLSFVDGTSDVVLDSTYPIYVFEFINMHPATNNVNFTFNMSIDSGSNYNVTKTTTFFQASNDEAAASGSLNYEAGRDLVQSTADQMLHSGVGGDNDQVCAGLLYLLAPSDTAYVKHFFYQGSNAHQADAHLQQFVGGYGNTTSAVDAVQFKMSSGNIDAGTIKLYGLAGS